MKKFETILIWSALALGAAILAAQYLLFKAWGLPYGL